jgi:valyl-tRNA synthetase
MELRHVDSFRRLSIKIDNAFKFFYNARKAIEEASGSKVVIKPIDQVLNSNEMALHDLHMLHSLRKLVVLCNAAFENRKLYKATDAIRAFVFNEFCDVYLEFVKKELALDADPAVCPFRPTNGELCLLTIVNIREGKSL